MKYNSYQRGAGEGEGILILAFLGLVIWGVLWLFGFSFGIESEGVVTYSDCRQIITIQDHSWQTYTMKFTCSYDKTQSGKIMDGTCVHVVLASGLFSSSGACETAYVYQKNQDPACQNNTKDGVAYPYLGYDDMCYTAPQAGETAVSPAPNTSSQTPPANTTSGQASGDSSSGNSSASTGTLPTVVGQCDSTTISQIGTRLTDGTTGQDIAGSGSAITYADGGYQVSYDTEASVQDWSVGDQVNLCLVSIPSDCPTGDDRGIVYQATNIRTGETWEAQNSEHSCGGA